MAKQWRARRLAAGLVRFGKSPSTDLQRFASGIKRDYTAVKAALVLRWSHEQAEGRSRAGNISEKAEVRMGSLRPAALAHPQQSLIPAPHSMRRSL
jgi:hypothetical protein